MNQHVALPPGKLTADEFCDFIKDRPREERWQLIDGEPFMMMSPARLAHQRIAMNLARLLNDALDHRMPELFAMVEIGLKIEGQQDYRPVADLAVLGEGAHDEVYGEHFKLVAEILSPSNTTEHISRKRELYAQAPSCLYVLIIAQDDFAVEVWEQASGWTGRILRSADDLIELPEFGFSCHVADLYKGVQFK